MDLQILIFKFLIATKIIFKILQKYFLKCHNFTKCAKKLDLKLTTVKIQNFAGARETKISLRHNSIVTVVFYQI